jgi:hypothetical protein
VCVSKEFESYVVEQVALIVGLAAIALSAHACVAAAVREKPELNDPFTLVSSPDGRLFCYVGFGLRILALDSDGHLLASWPVPAGGGVARLRAHSDHLEVATIRTNRRLLYTFEGVLIASHDDAAAFAQLQTSHRARLPGGAFAEIRGQALVRVEPTGAEVVLVPPRPWPLTDMPMSSSLIALAAVPGAIGVVFAWALRRARLEPAAF